MDTKKKILTAVRVFIALVVWFGIYKGLDLIVRPLLSGKIPDIAYSLIASTVLPYAVAMPLALIVLRGTETAQSRTPLMKPGFANMAKIFVIQSGLSVSVMFPVGILVKILNIKTPAVTAEQILAQPLFYCFLLLFFAPLAEEFLFRKVFFDRLMVLGTKPAVLLSALFFALPHLFSQGPAQLFYTFVLGLSFGFVTARTRKIWPAVILHSLSNLYCGLIAAVWPVDIPLAMLAYVAIYVLAMPAAAAVLLIVNRRNLLLKDL